MAKEVQELKENAVNKKSLFFKDCGNRICVYNVNGNCRCRGIGSECRGYNRAGKDGKNGTV